MTLFEVAVLRPTVALVQWDDGEKFLTIPQGATVRDVTVGPTSAAGIVLIDGSPGDPSGGVMEADAIFTGTPADWWGADARFRIVAPVVLCPEPFLMTTDDLYEIADALGESSPLGDDLYDIGIRVEREAAGAMWDSPTPDEHPDPDPGLVIDTTGRPATKSFDATRAIGVSSCP